MSVLLGTIGAANAGILTWDCGAGTCSSSGCTPTNSVTATLDTETGVLTISGTGRMIDYSYQVPGTSDYPLAPRPWYNWYNVDITSVVIEQGVTYIGSGAFYGCSRLTSASIPNSVTSIGKSAFQNCTSLTSASIPNSVTSIGESAFQNCTSLTSVTIPNSVTGIGASAFYGCTNLTVASIPSSVIYFGNYAFQGCKKLTSVNIGNYRSGNNDVGVFDGCHIEKLTIEDSNTPLTMVSTSYRSGTGSASNPYVYTYYSLFYGCSVDTLYLGRDIAVASGGSPFSPLYTSPLGTLCKKVTIGNNVTSIASWVTLNFDDSDSITEINIGSGLTSTKNLPIDGNGLLAINVDVANYTFSSEDGVLFNKDKTTLVRYPAGKQGAYTIPDGVSTITGLSTITDYVTGNSDVISYGAFQYCKGLTSVTIPNSVTFIGSRGFYGCTGLREVRCLRAAPVPLNDIAFYSNMYASIANYNVFGGSTSTVYANASLNVPANAVSLYQSADVWKNFSSITGVAEYKDFAVIFNSDGGSAVTSQSLEKGAKITKPANPTRGIDIFEGWYTSTAYTTTWNFNADTISSNLTLYAKWTPRYTVTFNSQSGSSVSPQTNLLSGAKLTQPTNPTRSNYTFAGWYKESGYSNIWNFVTDTIAASNITLYAKWVSTSVPFYTITFNVNGGSTVASQIVAQGEKVIQPAHPTKSGSAFVGWYSDAALTTAWNFASDIITANVTTLYAKWTTAVNAATPAITTQPQGSTASVNGSVTLSVTATKSDNGTLSYQWYSNATNSTSGGTAVSGATSATYAPPTATVGTKYYYVVVTNTNNSVNGTKTATATSNAAAVTVSATTSVAVTGVAVSPTTLSLAPNATQQLTATITPSNATNKNVTWASSNTNVATVATDGRVTAKAAGTANITVTTQDGSKTAVCTVTVSTTGGSGDGGKDPATAVATQNVSSLFVYPNPVRDQITITSDQWNAVGAGSARPSIEIYNVNGTKVFETSLSIVNYPLSINIAHLPAGVYIVKVGNKAAKVVKQ
ncbi:hypothetical protein FACS1894156_1980 [Bacteroidia bacterium]|nr:hypothetical protein FACS1894156_1980 [Bacteroidia bacterium]